MARIGYQSEECSISSQHCEKECKKNYTTLFYKGLDTNDIEFYCGATVISHKYVLTVRELSLTIIIDLIVYSRLQLTITIISTPRLHTAQKKLIRESLKCMCFFSYIKLHYYLLSMVYNIKVKKIIPTFRAVVRLGEYNTLTDVDCSPESGPDFCSRAVDLPIEKIIHHPGYNLENKTDDIELIRVSFKDY